MTDRVAHPAVRKVHMPTGRLVVALVALGLIAASCSDSSTTTTSAFVRTSIPAKFFPDSIVSVVDGSSDWVFDQAELRTYELTLPRESLEFLDAAPALEEYVEGYMEVAGQAVGPVGIRYKGSIGAFVGCVSGPNFADPSGHKACTKLSLKVKVNWSDSTNSFRGIRKLQFHSQNLDETQLHERLGYWLFREMGVPAPRSVHARLVVNGEFVGLFALTEQIDGRFTRENFDDGTGNLYKEVWPVTEDRKVEADSVLLAALKTNENQGPSLEVIQEFGNDVLNSQNSRETVADWMDMREVLAMAVVDRTIRHDDGVFHWYCDQGCRSHNFFWYEEPSRRTMHLIPWDLDNSFENIVADANPVTPIKDGWGEITNECGFFAYGAFAIRQRSAACDPIIGAWTKFSEEYEQLLDEFVAGPFSEESVDAVLTMWEDQIADATAEAAGAHDDALAVAAWRGAVTDLRDSLEFAREKAAS